jgi:hypothetical protein
MAKLEFSEIKHCPAMQVFFILEPEIYREREGFLKKTAGRMNS